MIKHLIVLFGVLFIVPSFGADIYLKAGRNNSWFATEGGTSKTNPAYAMGLYLPIDQEKRIKLAVNILYVEQEMTLCDKSWPAHEFFEEECGATLGNLNLHYHYLKFPIYLNSDIYRRNNLTVFMNIGVEGGFTLGRSSDVTNRSHDDNLCEYDYKRVNSDEHPAYPLQFIIGTGFSYRWIGFELSYNYTFGETEFLYGLNIQDRVHSIRGMLTWHFKFKRPQ